MSATIAKGRFWGSGRDKGRLFNYSKYIQHRSGPDREPGGRQFFDREDDISAKSFRDELAKTDGRGVIGHEFILSPGLNTVDQEAYTRELMEKLEQEKGQQFRWLGSAHGNTEHGHIHVIVFGTDEEGRRVNFRRADYDHLREWGDKYLEREHGLERGLEREVSAAERELSGKEQQKEKGLPDPAYTKVLFGIEGGKEQGRQQEQEREQSKESQEQYKAKGALERLRASSVKEREAAIAELPEEEKIVSSGVVYTKFTELAELHAFDVRLREGTEPRLAKEDYRLLWSWIGKRSGPPSIRKRNNQRSKAQVRTKSSRVILRTLKSTRPKSARLKSTRRSRRKKSRRAKMDKATRAKTNKKRRPWPKRSRPNIRKGHGIKSGR